MLKTLLLWVTIFGQLIIFTGYLFSPLCKYFIPITNSIRKNTFKLNELNETINCQKIIPL